MQIGGDGRWGRHGVRQPEMERELGALRERRETLDKGRNVKVVRADA